MSNITPLEINFEPTKKQDLMFELFDDSTTREVLFGGSAGSSKSYGLCALIILKALEYPGIRIGLARNELTTLKKTTMVSFFEVTSNWGLITDEHFSYNSTGGIIKFYNGSEIILMELSYKPSDPNYTRLGGHLLTFGVIDEVGEVDERGYSIFKTRLNRWKNKELGVKGICISTCNPTKGWLYNKFYRPSIEKTLSIDLQFIQALPTDNPYIPKEYLDTLRKLPYAQRERLLMGNWDYDDSPNSLLTYEEILNVWDNVQKDSMSKNYISADIAFTSDKCVILIWNGYVVVDIIVSPNGNIEDVIKELAQIHNVPNYNITYDSDGVGKFLDQRLRNAKPIVNNARPFKNENYKNLKTQLYYKLAEKIKDNSVKIAVESNKDDIIEELQVIEYKPTNNVGKIEMVDKAAVKRKIGRSPDFSDALAYRMIFEYKSSGTKTFRII